MAVKFIIDSASDILPDEAERLGMLHLPLHILFGDREYADAVDLDHRAFYEKLVESDVIPTTSQVTPEAFASAYERVTAAGDTAVVVTISSRLSGTWQSAVIAAEGYEGRVFVVDSENVCVGERILILRGLALRDQGLSAGEIARQLEAERGRIRLIALLETLEYLKKGGRISAATALAGGILSIKPVIAVENGEVVLVGKARGSRRGNNLLRELIEKNGGIDFERPFCLAYSGLSDTLLRKYIDDSAELWDPYVHSLPVASIGCTIGTHAGPGAIALAFFAGEGAERG